jgi:hypothetical protein
MANIERLEQVYNLILEKPEYWNQITWHIHRNYLDDNDVLQRKYQHCFAGIAQLLSRNLQLTDIVDLDSYSSCYEEAKEWLDLSHLYAGRLFYEFNTLEDLRKIIDEIATKEFSLDPITA